MVKFLEKSQKISNIGMVCSAAALFNSGCSTIILENDAIRDISNFNQVRFEYPVCISLDYKTNDTDAFNRSAGVQGMGKLYRARVSSGLSSFNILENCKTPIASYTVILSKKTRNWWIRWPWAAASFLTLGIIPFYVEEDKGLQLFENDRLINELEFKEKRLTTFLALPWWFRQNIQTSETYQVDAQRAFISYKQAILIKKAVEKNQKTSKP